MLEICEPDTRKRLNIYVLSDTIWYVMGKDVDGGIICSKFMCKVTFTMELHVFNFGVFKLFGIVMAAGPV